MADQNDKVREAWNTNARFWDSRMAEGNDWFNTLIWPRVETLLQMRQGDTVLDIACGNGLTSRRVARGGARVVAFDFSEQMIRLAKERGGNNGIDHRVVDATDADVLSGLGPGRFDAALCNMALMDMADVRPLMEALSSLLRPAGRFVFSVLHPCFNNPAIDDQPVPHPYFHRPLARLLGEGFEAGLVLESEPAALDTIELVDDVPTICTLIPAHQNERVALAASRNRKRDCAAGHSLLNN